MVLTNGRYEFDWADFEAKIRDCRMWMFCNPQNQMCIRDRPQAIRNIMPQIGNNLIINIKDTSVLSVISIVDLFFVHKSVAGALYTYFESATIVMAIYLTMTLVTSRLLLLVEKKMDGDANYELVDTMDIGNQLRTIRENDGEGRRG